VIKGTRLGDYEIVSLVGSGGMGEVYRARDTKLNRDVAIKVLPRYWSRDPDRLQRFDLEARAAAALNHPNITSIFHVGQHDGSPYMVTELLQGETLRERLRRGPIPLRKAIEYAVQIAHGLAAAHDRGIVHRDLKPENVFVTKDGRVKILDFGLARLGPSKEASGEEATVTHRTDPGVVLGTAAYMSPEQVRGKTVDHRADIFALGTILYEMVTGKQPFRKSTSAETMTAILNEEPPSISQITPIASPGMQRIVHRCLEKDPEQRFHSSHDLAFALEALSDLSSGMSHDVQQTKSSKRWIWIVVSAAVVAITAAVVIWWNRPPAVPVVEAITQLTDDGAPKNGPLLTDGARIYFNEGSAGSWKIVQVSVAGGETSDVSTKLTNPEVAAIAPDGSSLLALVGIRTPQALWTIPLPTGEPRRLGTIEAKGAGFFPNGRVLFTADKDLYDADKDGSNGRKLVTGPDNLFCPHVSPDGRRILLGVDVPGEPVFAIAEVAADGSGFHEILRGTPDSDISCGSWTPDGKYLLYRREHLLRADAFTLAVPSGFSRRYGRPTQLTNGPWSYTSVISSRDQKHIYAIGTRPRAELARFDPNSRQFVPFLGGISATHPSFSRDGKWVAYRSYSDHTLWRSRADGTDPLQLTSPPLDVSDPVISPDGKQVAFQSWFGETYIIGMDGGTPRKIAANFSYHGSLSPDGNSIVYSTWAGDTHEGLRTLNLRDGTAALLPASQDKISPFWITEDTLVGATQDQKKLVIFDFKSGKWSDLLNSPGSGVYAVAGWQIHLLHHRRKRPECKSYKTDGPQGGVADQSERPAPYRRYRSQHHTAFRRSGWFPSLRPRHRHARDLRTHNQVAIAEGSPMSGVKSS
jgi:serine/threonine protein kinase